MLSSALIRNLQGDATLVPLLPTLENNRPQGDEWVSCATLYQPDSLTALLESFALEAGHPDGDRRAMASLWSRWYFHTTMTPLIAALVLQRACPVPHSVRVTAGRGVGLYWAQEAPIVHTQEDRSASEYPIRLAEPVIQALAQTSGAAPRVFWSNLGSLLEYLVCRMRPHPNADASLLQALEATLDSPALADGSPNPVCRPVRYQADTQSGTIRVRRLCCLYYLLPDTELCSDCPRLHPHRTHCHVPT